MKQAQIRFAGAPLNWIASIPSEPGQKPRYFQAIGAAVLAAVLLWLVVTSTFVAYLAEQAPEVALEFNASDPVALLNGLETKLAALQTGEAATAHFNRQARDEIEALAKHVLDADPLNARALGILAQLSIGDPDIKRTETLMRATVRLSLHETFAVAWLMQLDFERKNYAAAIQGADTLLRTQPQLSEVAVPVLARIAETDKGRPPLEAVLAANPPWRSSFFSSLQASISDARTPLTLLLHLKQTQNPPTIDDLRRYLEFLMQHKFYEVAYYTWLQFLTPEQLGRAGLLFNGGFQYPVDGLPFNWRLESGDGATVDIVEQSDAAGQHALSIEFGLGLVTLPSIAQTVLLPPGAYRLALNYRGSIATRRGLAWQVACAENPTTALGKSPLITGFAPKWTPLSFTFEVPATGCRAQTVALNLDARSASEQLVSGSVLFEDVRLSRIR